ncbi:MAG: mechanosensitive ion channel family protein [Candidatus Zixiibacteriota bacterium]|nr:MAG: mechanosensitive ion channel family protein [candidate division Zixibacteria bacterium]
MGKFSAEILIELRDWMIIHVPKIILILIGMWVAIKIAKFIGNRIKAYTEDEDPSRQSEREKRTETLVQMINTVVKVIVIAFGVLMIIREFGIDIGPLLAGAGILGLAVGFGSQALVKDVVTGFFILMENQFRVGDVISVAGHSGVVERITLRTTVLRDLEGVVHVIPNGEMSSISNLTYGWSRAVLEIGVAYKENVDRVMEIMMDVAKSMASEPEWKEIIIDEPTMLGVNSFDDSAVTIKIIMKTLPLSQWSVAREYRRRIKNRFDADGIEIPFPYRTVTIDKETLEVLKR